MVEQVERGYSFAALRVFGSLPVSRASGMTLTSSLSRDFGSLSGSRAALTCCRAFVLGCQWLNCCRSCWISSANKARISASSKIPRIAHGRKKGLLGTRGSYASYSDTGGSDAPVRGIRVAVEDDASDRDVLWLANVGGVVSRR